MSYKGIKYMGDIRDTDSCMLLGVTGGIATGKTTVSLVLEELGAKTIDFDVLSREVVAPGKSAWKEITAYFGKEVLKEDETLDRKKLSEIVFHDTAKRKKLEGFIHPRTLDEFTRMVKEYAAEDPKVIIQGVVPLLIEKNLQHLFHKILLVYTPESIQIERLIKRDGISREMATSILRAQMPIEEKKKYADYIVNNSGSIEEIRRQVEEVWLKLKKFDNLM
jgi:dephospho-CoA kinase